MDAIDTHFFPPSSSVLVALSCLEPPSPILSAIGVSCSDDHIPILLDSAFFESEKPDSATASFCADRRVSVGTFGPIDIDPQNSFPGSPVLPIHPDSSLDSNLNQPPSPVSQSSPSSPAGSFIQDIEASGLEFPGFVQSTSLSSHTLAHLSPSLLPANFCSSSTRIRHKCKLPIDLDCHDPVLTASKPWRQDSESQENMLAPLENLLAVHESQQPQPFQDVRSPLIQSPLHCPSPPRTHDYGEFSVPENLGWLRDTVIELFVDQEGFRAAHLAFRFVGFRKQVRGWDSLDGGWALFRPLNRESFRFHYAPLDSLPVLRRLTINGDETHDYISRQASLSLKTNGVYVVQGSESPHVPASCLSGSLKTNICPAKLSWKFEYLVDNRTERTGRILDGEKTLTPLMFTCSPRLLHRSQGRKMKLMHVVKKSVIIKLVAEKLEPPALPSRLPSLPARPVASHHLWTFHRRVQSHVDELKMGNLKKAGSFRQADERSETKKRPDENQGYAVGRRRRASSAGEDRRPKSESCSTALRLPENTALGRHILSRAQLADLMNTENKEADGGPCCSVGKLPSLSPAPRR